MEQRGTSWFESESVGWNGVFFVVQILNLRDYLVGLLSVEIAEAFLYDIADHGVDEPVDKFGVRQLADCVLNHVALGVDEVS